MDLLVLEERYSIYQFPKGSTLPDWVYSSEFYSVTETADELSVVARQADSYPDGVFSSHDWRIIKVKGPLDLSMTGIIAGITAILNEKKIPVFVISTYDTDYILVKESDFGTGIHALREKGYSVHVK